MNTKVTIGAVSCVVAGWAWMSPLSISAPSPTRVETQVFMRQKLAASQAVLEGLALEKFDLVSKNAVRMREMTLTNSWFILRHPDYMTHTTNFQKSVEALYMAAVDKNLDAATEAYSKVARNCVECHRMVRLEQRKLPVQN